MTRIFVAKLRRLQPAGSTIIITDASYAYSSRGEQIKSAAKLPVKMSQLGAVKVQLR